MCSTKLSKFKKTREFFKYYILEFEGSSLVCFNLFDSSILFADKYVCSLHRLDALICNKLRFGILRRKLLTRAHSAIRLETQYKDITRSIEVTNKKKIRIYNTSNT